MFVINQYWKVLLLDSLRRMLKGSVQRNLQSSSLFHVNILQMFHSFLIIRYSVFFSVLKFVYECFCTVNKTERGSGNFFSSEIKLTIWDVSNYQLFRDRKKPLTISLLPYSFLKLPKFLPIVYKQDKLLGIITQFIFE